MKKQRMIGWLLAVVMLLGTAFIPGAAFAAAVPGIEVTYESDSGQAVTPSENGETFWLTMKLTNVESVAGLAIKIKYNPESVQIVDGKGNPAANMGVASKNLMTTIKYTDEEAGILEPIPAFDSTGPKVKNDQGYFALYHSSVIGGGPFVEYTLTDAENASGLPVGQIRFKVVNNTKTPDFKFDYKAENLDGGFFKDKIKKGTEYNSAETFHSNFAPVGFGPQAPKAPNVKAEATAKGEITVSWTPNGAAATSYEISGNGATSMQTETTKVFSGLDNGKEYTFTVKGINDVGPGAAGTARATTWDVPGAPQNLRGSNTGSLEITFNWVAPASDGGATLSGYTLTVTDQDGGIVAGSPFTLGADETRKAIGGLTEGHRYMASITAKNAVGSSQQDALSEAIVAKNVVSAGMPMFIKNLEAAVNATYGEELPLTVEAAVNEAQETEKGEHDLSYQWYEAASADGSSPAAISGATSVSYTAKLTKAGTRYFYCEATNRNDLSKVPQEIKGEKSATVKSAVTTVTVGQKALNTEGITVNKTASIYKGGELDLTTLLTMNATAGAVTGESAAQVLDLANDKVSDGAIVTFKKSGAAVTAAAIAHADVIKTNGSYDYTVSIPKEGSSTNYILSGPVTGTGTLTVKTKSSGGGGGGGGSSSGSSTTTGTDVKKDLASNGEASISASEVKNAKSIEARNRQITITLNQQAVKALDQTTGLIIKSEKNGAALNDQAKGLLGSRTVFDVTATQNGKPVTSFGSGKITISIAYTPASGEDTGKLFLYNVNGDGEAEKVSGSSYDTTLQAVTGQTSHLSLYAVGYDENAAGTAKPEAGKGVFRDVSSSDWFYRAVMELAGKEILSGIPDEDVKGNPTGSYTFRPQNNVTRAEFVTMLTKAAGADLNKYSAKVFNDVNVNDWYAGAVAWANSTGVASGTGDGSFSPNANITRQDMAVMVSKYMTNVAKTTLTAKNEKITFSDGLQIADYAKNAVESMQAAGVLSGIPNEDAKGIPIGTYQFRPLANATRAEAVAMLSGLLSTL